MKIPFIDIDALPPKQREKLLLSETEVDNYNEAVPGKPTSAEDFYSWPNGKFWKQRKRRANGGGYISAKMAAKVVGWSRGLLVRHIQNNVPAWTKEHGVIERKRRRRRTVWFSKVLLKRLFPDSY